MSLKKAASSTFDEKKIVQDQAPQSSIANNFSPRGKPINRPNGPTLNISSKPRSETTSIPSPPRKHSKINPSPFDSPGTHQTSPQSSPSTPHACPKTSPVTKNVNPPHVPSTPKISVPRSHASFNFDHLSSSTTSSPTVQRWNPAGSDSLDNSVKTGPSSYKSTDSDHKTTFPSNHQESKESDEGPSTPNINVQSTHAASNFDHFSRSATSSPAVSEPVDKVDQTGTSSNTTRDLDQKHPFLVLTMNQKNQMTVLPTILRCP